MIVIDENGKVCEANNVWQEIISSLMPELDDVARQRLIIRKHKIASQCY